MAGLGQLGALAGMNALLPAWARVAGQVLGGGERHRDVLIDLAIEKLNTPIAGQMGTVTAVNGTVPGPLLEFYEGGSVTLNVSNHMAVDSSIHWHGILLPYQMDGVPGVTFPGIRPGENFTYQYPVKQSGTYWYHSHSGLQEQSGLYGPLVIHPAEPESFSFDRDYIVMLSDWTFEDPHDVFAKLKASSDYYNFQRPTFGDFLGDMDQQGFKAALADRLAWARMRMDPADLADVTGYTYSYLMNGRHAAGNWTGLFAPGETIRLRFINGSAMSIFDVRIPGLDMTVVAADGQPVKPVTVQEFRIGTAETYDVLVQPGSEKAYTVFAESLDRSGHARGTLATQPGLQAAVPEPRKRPLRSMAAMGHGMDHSSMKGMSHMDHDMSGHAGHDMKMDAMHEHGSGAAMLAENPQNQLSEPGVGLEDAGHRVLVYSDLEAPGPWPDQRAPSREVELHLTGNMERYMWSFDGKQFHEVREPIHFHHGERLRLTMVNDTMMEHPIHLHGMWMELVNGAKNKPRKHTILIKPGEKIALDISADAPGRWAFHCHLLFHMHMGMMRVVEVS